LIWESALILIQRAPVSRPISREGKFRLALDGAAGLSSRVLQRRQIQMATEQEWIDRIKLGQSVPGYKVIERRSKGLQAIRQRCLWHLLSVAHEEIAHSLVLRWHRQAEYMNTRTVLGESFELTFYGGARPVNGLFPDLWILCYPEDPEVKKKVEAEIAQMCKEIVKHS